MSNPPPLKRTRKAELSSPQPPEGEAELSQPPEREAELSSPQPPEGEAELSQPPEQEAELSSPPPEGKYQDVICNISQYYNKPCLWFFTHSLTPHSFLFM